MTTFPTNSPLYGDGDLRSAAFLQGIEPLDWMEFELLDPLDGGPLIFELKEIKKKCSNSGPKCNGTISCQGKFGIKYNNGKLVK
jgi:hypothetical protein